MLLHPARGEMFIAPQFLLTSSSFRSGIIKADSSNFINKKRWIRGRFSWQEGYGAFSYGYSQLDTIIRYIQNQEPHHRRRSFKDEYLTWLKKFEIPFEEKYVFQFME